MNRDSSRLRLLLLLALTIPAVFTNAQPSIPNPGISTDSVHQNNARIREKLVELALQNPNVEISQRQVTIADIELKKSKQKILGNLAVQGNLNEFSINKSANVLNYYPRYNIGVNIPLDLFVTRNNDIKIAKENLGMAMAGKNQQAREIRALVLTSYEAYLMHRQKLVFQNQLTEEANTTFKQKEKDFSQGVIPEEIYNQAYRSWTEEQSKKAELQYNVNVAVIELEKLIGQPLEPILAKQ